MPTRAISSPLRQALYNVFVRPSLAPATCHLTPNAQPCYPTVSTLPTTFQSYRTLYVKRRTPTGGRKLPSLDSFAVLDERIGAKVVQLVDADNKIQPPVLLVELLQSIDRNVEHIRKLSQTAEGVPVVKLFTKKSLHEERRSKVAVKADRKSEEDLTKQVELTWAITDNDLGYRLTRMENFLREGRRVEVLIAPKKGGRKASREEILAVLRKIREKAEEVEGAGEWKQMEGVVGAQVTIFFQSKEHRQQVKEAEKGEAVAKETERLERREREKAEEREKQERRLARKKEAEERRARFKDEVAQ